MGMRKQVLVMPSAAQAGAGNSTQLAGVDVNGNPYPGGLPVFECDDLAVDVNLTVGTGIVFGIDRLGLDGVWYNIAVSTSISAGTKFSTTLAAQNSQSQSFGSHVRLTWSGACTFSASIIGK